MTACTLPYPCLFHFHSSTSPALHPALRPAPASTAPARCAAARAVERRRPSTRDCAPSAPCTTTQPTCCNSSAPATCNKWMAVRGRRQGTRGGRAGGASARDGMATSAGSVAAGGGKVLGPFPPPCWTGRVIPLGLSAHLLGPALRLLVPFPPRGGLHAGDPPWAACTIDQGAAGTGGLQGRLHT